MNNSEKNIIEWWNPEWNVFRIALCVTGSVARGEETPHSDIDLLLIHDPEEACVRLSERIIRMLHTRFEHISVVARSLEEHDATLLNDLRSLTAQADTRLLTGDPELFRLFRRQLCGQIVQNRQSVLNSLRESSQERHRHYGETVALLEPNIKNSAGALRDIHIMGYIAVSLHAEECFSTEQDSMISVPDRISILDLQEQRKKDLLSAYRFMLNVRRSMHECSGHLHDILGFDLQRSVAEAMGYGSRDEKSAVEEFMRDYYRHARVVHISQELLFHDVLQHGSDPLVLFSDTGSPKPIPESELPEEVLRMFLRSCETGEPVSIALMRTLDRHPELDFSTFEVRKIFDEILRQPKNVAATLSRMHDMRILGRLMPEFSLLDHFFQHNIYHYFTADEHTLRALHACESLHGSGEHAERALHRISDMSVLHYAILLHDAAKPIDLSNHEDVGAELAPVVLSRHGREDIVDDVVFLVRNHLFMEQIAFRRNIRESATIRAFVELLENEKRLDLLYVLTWSDMSALNPGVLTEWKKELLAELYDITRVYFETGDIAHAPVPAEYDAEPVSSMSSHEFRTAVQDIFEGEQVRMHITHHRAFSEVTVFCVDRPQLLSRLSAAFFGADCTIVDAMIETRNDVVIDVFRVIDIISGKHLSVEQAHSLERLIRQVCAGTLNSEELYHRYRRKWIRRLRKMPKTDVRQDVEYVAHVTDSGEEQTIIEVYAPDTFGLLYRVAGEISRFGLNVVFAKIATRVDGVVDSFYVVDEKGKPFTDENKRKQLREQLLSHITSLTQ